MNHTNGKSLPHYVYPEGAPESLLTGTPESDDEFD
jgi:hypothetical protein